VQVLIAAVSSESNTYAKPISITSSFAQTPLPRYFNDDFGKLLPKSVSMSSSELNSTSSSFLPMEMVDDALGPALTKP
jgi:hypothetical protein